MIRQYAAAVGLLLIAALPNAATAQGRLEISENARFQFVRLWNEDMMAWLEKGNGPEAGECRRTTSSFDAARACIQTAIGSLVRTFALREKPDEGATEIGILRISATPGTGLSVAVIPAGGAVSMPLAPGLAQPDFGYDYAHDVTLRGLDGDWVAIAVPGGAGIGWFQREPAPDVATGHYVQNDTVVVGYPRGLEVESIYVYGDRSVVLLEIGADSFVIREEQAQDMFCDMGTPPALQPYEAERLSWRDAYDADGRLMLLPKYMRGC